MFKKEHKGIGGLYFISTSIICSIILSFTLQFSWASQASAMADNIAYIVSINCSAYSYLDNRDSYIAINPNYPSEFGSRYYPLDDFNSMAKKAGLTENGANEIIVTWRGNGYGNDNTMPHNSAKVQIGEFETSLGLTIKPKEQSSVIENY